MTELLKVTGLRRRVHTKQEEVKEDDQETDKVKTQTESPTPEHRDPLKWFGILVPQNLKQAQSAFKEGKLCWDVFFLRLTIHQLKI